MTEYRKRMKEMASHREKYFPVMAMLKDMHDNFIDGGQPAEISGVDDIAIVLELIDIGYLDPDRFIVYREFSEIHGLSFRGGFPFTEAGWTIYRERLRTEVSGFFRFPMLRLGIALLIAAAVLAVIILMSVSARASEAWRGMTVSAQGAAVFQGYNDVRLPGDSGSRLSFSDDLDSGPVFSPRFEASYVFSDRHYVSAMASFLRISASGTLDRDILFDDILFAEGTDVDGFYRFDSYRLTWRYIFFNSPVFKFSAGLTGKVRDAEITLKSGSEKGSLSNRGGVVLLSFCLEAAVTERLSFITCGDGLWSPYGRAEDVFAGMKYDVTEGASFLAGYRMLEGGADNDEVYTFSMFHYAVAGAEYRF